MKHVYIVFIATVLLSLHRQTYTYSSFKRFSHSPRDHTITLNEITISICWIGLQFSSHACINQTQGRCGCEGQCGGWKKKILQVKEVSWSSIVLEDCQHAVIDKFLCMVAGCALEQMYVTGCLRTGQHGSRLTRWPINKYAYEITQMGSVHLCVSFHA